ncbi:MAG: AbrB/MazE/SpoVT family DNA-binding domain-containing protein [Calditrichaeota bacterium]|nr:AbrB/MazE/SpoVT family DNA-binding domain-containing protein [Calditrichota bacterium]
MKVGTYIAELNDQYQIHIPVELREKLKLEPGDKIEVSIKKIKSRRLEALILQNPLHKLLKLIDEQ